MRLVHETLRSQIDSSELGDTAANTVSCGGELLAGREDLSLGDRKVRG